MPTRQQKYDMVAGQARTEEAGGLTKDRAVLLLWYLRNVIGLDALDAYDNVCDGPNDWGVDGLYLESDVDGTDNEVLIILQSKYAETPKELRKSDVQGLVSSAAHFRTVAALETMLKGPIEPPLKELIERYRLVDKAKDGWLASGQLKIELVLVTTCFAGRDSINEANAANAAAGSDLLTLEDIDRIGPVAFAVNSRSPRPETLSVRVLTSEVLVTGIPGDRVAVAPIRALDIVKWPGIGDRSLFDLNVRRSMGRNRVRGELDAAINRATDHPNFLAYHNGLTVVCDSFKTLPPDTLEITKPSVVNGAQSVLAFAANASGLSDDLRVFVKLVEVAHRPNLAREVSRRSNTQNPVNPRMLMANSGPQLRLEQEVARLFPGITYVTRPDAEVKTTTRTINNDDAAQLLTALFLQRPWLAVKRNSLFESENHAAVFQQEHTAAHVVLADELGLAVDRALGNVPDYYRESWKLTRIVMVYLAGQVLREGEEVGDHNLVSNPSAAFDNTTIPPSLTADARARLDDAVRLAAFALKERSEAKVGSLDDYKKDFKNETELKGLGAAARNLYRLRPQLPPAPPSA